MKSDQLRNIFFTHQGQWLSGNQLAEQMGISRTMVWKHIQALREAGYQIVSKQNAGYQYQGSPNLDGPTIEFLAQHPVAVTALAEVNSTNTYAKQIVSKTPLTKPMAILANRQTAGYGRRGRHFYSPGETGLYITIAVPANQKPFDPGLLTTSTAVAVVNALKRSYPSVLFGVKWINDIWVAGQKVGGIMTESIMDVELMQPSTIIIGIGLNLTTEHFPAAINQPVSAISTHSIDRNRLAADIIDAFLATYPDYQSGAAMAQYRQLSVVIGHQVTLQLPKGQLVGTVESINDAGAMLLRDERGTIHTVMTGEVIKVRLAD